MLVRSIRSIRSMRLTVSTTRADDNIECDQHATSETAEKDESRDKDDEGSPPTLTG